MKETYDVVIIGGGIVGNSIARELSKYQLKTCLIEKEYEVSFGVSKANSGIVHAGVHSPAGTMKARLCARGNELYGVLEKELGIPFKRVGELVVIKQEDDFKVLEEILENAQKNNIPDVRILNKSEVHNIEENLSDDIVGALYAPTAGVTNPYEFVYLLAENAQKNGVVYKTNEEVIAIKDKIVTTTKNQYQTQFIINSAGLYGDRIANMVGLNDFKITPRKGEEYLLDKKCRGMIKHILFPLPSKTSKGTLVIPTLDGTIMIGPSAEEVKVKNDLSTTDDTCWEILDKAQQMIPDLKAKNLISAFAGLRPVATGEDFIIGKTSVKGFINVAGIQSPGLTAAPAIAEEVVSVLKEDGCILEYNNNFISNNGKCYKFREANEEEIHQLISEDADYGKVVCRCEMITQAEIKNAIKHGAKTLDGIKFRTRAGMGRCQGGFCSYKTIEIISKELKISPLEVTKKGPGSQILVEDIGSRHYEQ